MRFAGADGQSADNGLTPSVTLSTATVAVTGLFTIAPVESNTAPVASRSQDGVGQTERVPLSGGCHAPPIALTPSTSCGPHVIGPEPPLPALAPLALPPAPLVFAPAPPLFPLAPPPPSPVFQGSVAAALDAPAAPATPVMLPPVPPISPVVPCGTSGLG
jgi:putative membrane protein